MQAMVRWAAGAPSPNPTPCLRLVKIASPMQFGAAPDKNQGSAGLNPTGSLGFANNVAINIALETHRNFAAV